MPSHYCFGQRRSPFCVSLLFLSRSNLLNSSIAHCFPSNLSLKRQTRVLLQEEMAEVAKLLYIVVMDDEENGEKGKTSFRYTRSILQSTLQLMGCKARHAFKISQRVFELMRSECSVDAWVVSAGDTSKLNALKGQSQNGNDQSVSRFAEKVSNHVVLEEDGKISSKPFELYKRRTTIVVGRETFLAVVCDALAEYKYMGPNQKADLVLACRIRERKESVTVLLCGTSGCGKSTLSALLGSRLGITTVISTDSIRHMMRSFVDEKENPLLWASTYHAGECLDAEAIAAAKAKKKLKKLAGVSQFPSKDDVSDGSVGKLDIQPHESASSSPEPLSQKQMAIEGFKAQSEMVTDSLDRLITAWEERKESVVVEGVHLNLSFVMGLMKKHPSIIPFMIYITNEDKHLERFAVRAKYMTLDPAKNRYVKYIRNIRTIQEYLCKQADKHLVPKINNTNVDKSVAAIHATVFSCLRRREAGDPLYDPATRTASLVDEEYRNQCAANSLRSKCMLQLIQRQDSTRHLMALLNTDGSVVKAWPVDFINSSGKPITSMWTPIYGPLCIRKAEAVNLQFGHFGISAWASDTCGTSHASSVDESRGDTTDNGSRYYSSCCSSPRTSDGPAKELKEDDSVHGSDYEEDEIDDPYELESNEDFSDSDLEHIQEEMEGSVDEESTKSDEEYDDLAMQDFQYNGYWSDNKEFKNKVVPLSWEEPTCEVPGMHKDGHNLDSFSRIRSESLDELQWFSHSYLQKDNSEKRCPSFGDVRVQKPCPSIPPSAKHGSVTKCPNLAEAQHR
ncbi:hypothetical protein NMG60_11033216 [Bertholletia excelsa]